MQQKRIAYIFLALVIAQLMHSVEEVWFGLWRVIPPAYFIATLFTDNAGVGFLLANLALCLFGFWCFFARVLPGKSGAKFWMAFWALIELVNGIVHPVLSVVWGIYVPGTATAPLLLLLAAYLLGRLYFPAGFYINRISR